MRQKSKSQSVSFFTLIHCRLGKRILVFPLRGKWIIAIGHKSAVHLSSYPSGLLPVRLYSLGLPRSTIDNAEKMAHC